MLDITGTDTHADIRKLELVQKAGQLALDGRVEFKPVGWQLNASAREFNPGSLLPGWDGNVNLDATSKGVMQEAGPSGSLQLLKLDGNLRGRAIAGEGDIEFAAPSRLAGDLRLSSGKSRIAVQGNSGHDNEIDATIKLAVASLADWVPQAGGSLNGDFHVRGKWPALEIAGGADGRNLSFADHRIARLRVDAKSLTSAAGCKLGASASDLSLADTNPADRGGASVVGQHEVTLTARSEKSMPPSK